MEDGEKVGVTEGNEDGVIVGSAVGGEVGDCVGMCDGTDVGAAVGLSVGIANGYKDGKLLGMAVDGRLVGAAVGVLVGKHIGCFVGRGVGSPVGFKELGRMEGTLLVGRDVGSDDGNITQSAVDAAPGLLVLPAGQARHAVAPVALEYCPETQEEHKEEPPAPENEPAEQAGQLPD